MSDFNCPKCEEQYLIDDIELWEVYDEDGKETEFTCTHCQTNLIVTSSILQWSFSVEALDNE